MSADRVKLVKQWIKETEDKWDREPSFEVWLCQQLSYEETIARELWEALDMSVKDEQQIGHPLYEKVRDRYRGKFEK